MPVIRLSAMLWVVSAAAAAEAPSDRLMLQFEVDPTQTSSNTLQRPNNSTTTRFDAVDYTGKRATFGRFAAAYIVNGWRPGAELRLDLVPIQQSGTQVPPSAVRYAGSTFTPGAPLNVLYQFNTYRLTYDVPLFQEVAPERWEFRLGATLALRDAQTRLQQPGVRVNFVNLGPVPLLYAFSAWRISSTWRIESDLDAFPAPGGGGLLDTSARIAWSPLGHATLFAGVRYLAGGASDHTFFNFIHQRSALGGIRFTF